MTVGTIEIAARLAKSYFEHIRLKTEKRIIQIRSYVKRTQLRREESHNLINPLYSQEITTYYITMLHVFKIVFAIAFVTIILILTHYGLKLCGCQHRICKKS